MARRSGACSLKWITGVMGWWLVATGKPALQRLPSPAVQIQKTLHFWHNVCRERTQRKELRLIVFFVIFRVLLRPIHLGLRLAALGSFAFVCG